MMHSSLILFSFLFKFPLLKQELIKAKLASLNLYTDDVLSEYIIVLLNAGNDRQKLYEELVIFMNSPEVAEHFVIWLFGEVERLQQVQPVPVAVQQPQSQPQPPTQVQQPRSEYQAQEQIVQDVQMSSSGRLQGTRNFSKALESAVSTSNTRRTFSTSDDRNDRLDRSDRGGFDRSDRGDRSYDRNTEGRTRRSPSRRVIRSSTEESGKIQKIKFSVDFDREEQRFGNRRTGQKGNFKKIQTGGEDDSSILNVPAIKVKCQYWPNCRTGDACPNVHPTETCKNFPNCQFGDSCTFVHPSIPCKFQEKCQNPFCNYQHRPVAMSMIPSGAINPSLSTIQCKFYPRCVNVNCPYLHPVKVQCRYGVDCSRPDCPFEHPSGRKGAHLKSVVFAPCKYGKQCARSDCPYQHERDTETASVAVVAVDAVAANTMTDTLMDTSSNTPTIV
jgi:zinc finger CCCH domain-containing protein 14